MKLYMSIIALSLFALACSKDGPSTKISARNLEGTWELRAVSGGQVAGLGPIRPGNGDKLSFTPSEFTQYIKDTVYRRGSYSVSKGTGTDLNTGRRVDQFIFDQQPAESFELANDTLSLFYGMIAADGVIIKYVKIAE